MMRTLLRLPAFVVVAGVTAGVVVGDKDDAGAKADAILELTLPESADPPDYAPERVSKLLVDGKDHSTPRSTKRSVAVKLKKGATRAKGEDTFWPNTYTEMTRTKTVKVEKGKTVKVSFDKGDKDTPDKIRPIYVPTPEEVVDEMCKMAKITKDDVVYDIGCGDGRLVIAGVKKFKAKRG